MVVRDNRYFRKIMQHFDEKQSIILYSMWDGYRTKPGSSIPELLEIFHNWQPLHTSGHASCKDILTVIEKTKPETIVPIHTDKPELMREICSYQNVKIVKDGERIYLQSYSHWKHKEPEIRFAFANEVLLEEAQYFVKKRGILLTNF